MTCRTCGGYPLQWGRYEILLALLCTGCAEPEPDCYCEDAEGGDDSTE